MAEEKNVNIKIDNSKNANHGNVVENNNTIHLKQNKAKKAVSMIDTRTLIPFLLFLPFIIMAIIVAFDLPNYTYFKEIEINGIKLIKWDTFEYLKGIELSGQGIKSTFNGLIFTFIPPELDTSDWTKAIINVLIYIGNLILLPLKGIASLFTIPMLGLRILMALIGIQTTNNYTFLGQLYNWIQQIADFAVGGIPYWQ